MGCLHCIAAMQNDVVPVTIKGVMPTANGCAVFLGNEEKTFFIKPLNAHLLAGLQYALGDLQADDTPR